MKVLITICARGGSKGIPGKNIKLIGGKPLIYYSIKVAEEFKKYINADIYLSTDSEEIKETVHALKFEHIQTDYVRPSDLATDSAGKLGAIADVLCFAEAKYKKQYNYIIDLDVTSPLRTVTDLENALKMLSDNQQALNVFSVSPAHRNPYFNMVEEGENGFYKLCKQGKFLTRQSAPKVYDMNASFYIYKRVFFEQGFQTAMTDKSLVYEVPHPCFDLDEPLDFDYMEYLIENNKLDFFK